MIFLKISYLLTIYSLNPGCKARLIVSSTWCTAWKCLNSNKGFLVLLCIGMISYKKFSNMVLFQVHSNAIFKIYRDYLSINLDFLNFWMRLLSRCLLSVKRIVILYLLTWSFMLDIGVFKYCFSRLPEQLKLVDLREGCWYLYKNIYSCRL